MPAPVADELPDLQDGLLDLGAGHLLGVLIHGRVPEKDPGDLLRHLAGDLHGPDLQHRHGRAPLRLRQIQLDGHIPRGVEKAVGVCGGRAAFRLLPRRHIGRRRALQRRFKGAVVLAGDDPLLRGGLTAAQQEHHGRYGGRDTLFHMLVPLKQDAVSGSEGILAPLGIRSASRSLRYS